MIAPSIREVFGRFQNLNLLVLLEDLRWRSAARQAWLDGDSLCPVAHGLSAAAQVQTLKALGETDSLENGCRYAARCLGADYDAVLRFVRGWDEHRFSEIWLIRQLQALWRERLDDAIAVQMIIEEPRAAEDTRPPRIAL